MGSLKVLKATRLVCADHTRGCCSLGQPAVLGAVLHVPHHALVHSNFYLERYRVGYRFEKMKFWVWVLQVI